MIEPIIIYWTPLITALTGFVTLLIKVIELLSKWEIIMKFIRLLPVLIKRLVKFLIYSLSLFVPNTGIIWYFFYLAGIYRDRLSQAEFFWAIVAQPTLAVSIYAYVWSSRIYTRLKNILEKPESVTKPRRKSHNPK